jgi:DNA-binding CsgD family transcriptional regulator
VTGGHQLERRLVEPFARRPAPASAKPPELAELTERELALLRFVARGLSNAEIASSLFLTEATVKTHLTHILTNSTSATACKRSFSRTSRGWSSQAITRERIRRGSPFTQLTSARRSPVSCGRRTRATASR